MVLLRCLQVQGLHTQTQFKLERLERFKLCSNTNQLQGDAWDECISSLALCLCTSARESTQQQPPPPPLLLLLLLHAVVVVRTVLSATHKPPTESAEGMENRLQVNNQLQSVLLVLR